MPQIPNPTHEEVQAFERELLRRRGERVLAEEAKVRAELEAKVKAEKEAAENPQPPNLATPKMEIVYGPRAAKLSEQQALEMAEAMRATYSNYADMPEIIELQEAKLAKAFAADGFKLPPLSQEDRLKMLRRQHAGLK
jgi:hypothetical protein